MLKNIFIGLLFYFVSINIGIAQIPSIRWGINTNTDRGASGQGMAIDRDGNILVTGFFNSQELILGNITLNQINRSGDMFVVKYDPTGKPIWARSAGGTERDHGLSVTTDADGNVFVVGIYHSRSIDFDHINLTGTSGTDPEFFIAKYNPNGYIIWALNAAGTVSQYEPLGVITDADGNVYASGSFTSGQIHFGNGVSVGGFRNEDPFIVKYGPWGQPIWVKSAIGDLKIFANDITIDPDGNTVTVGSFNSETIIFGSTTLENTSSTNRPDIYVVKHDSDGNVLWAISGGGTLEDYGVSIASDLEGNIYATGRTRSSTITFGNITETVNHGLDNIYVVKLNPSGDAQWIKTFGGSLYDQPLSISTDHLGNITIAGKTNSPQLSFDGIVLYHNGVLDMPFYAKLNSDGNVIWAGSSDPDSSGRANAIVTDAEENTYVTGSFFSDSIKFRETLLRKNPDPNTQSDKFTLRLGEATMGIQDVMNTSEVTVTPNPSNGIFEIYSKDVFINNLTVYNSLGQEIKVNPTTSKGRTYIDLNGASAGMYLLKLETESGSIVKKLLLQK